VPPGITEIVLDATARIGPSDGLIIIYQAVTFRKFSPEALAHT
jgi:hypothetical protein